MALLWRKLIAAVAAASIVGGLAVPTTAHAHAVPTVVTISGRPVGGDLPNHFLGLAVENWTLTKHQFRSSNLGEYMRVLGSSGLLRIGGNSLDESFWTSHGEKKPAWATEGAFGPSSLRELAQALAGTGWRVILGVNLKHLDRARALDEARYAQRILGPELAAIEPGNEPDHYGISEQRFLRDFRAYVKALHTALPDVPIVGPDVASGGYDWLSEFSRQEAPRHQVLMVTLHEYPESACGDHPPDIADLLSLRDMHREQHAAKAAAAAGRLDHVPGIIDETNSAVCWGQPGMSNTYASALWLLDYTMVLAQSGLSEVNFQGRIADCAAYSPLCAVGRSHHLIARPEFYGLLAERQVTPGRFLRVTDPAVTTLRAYAVRAGDGSLSVVLDNLGAARAVRLRLPSGTGYTSASQTVLRTSSSLGLRSTSAADITLGGRRISSAAVFPAPRYTPVQVREASIVVSIAAHSAAILKVR